MCFVIQSETQHCVLLHASSLSWCFQHFSIFIFVIITLQWNITIVIMNNIYYYYIYTIINIIIMARNGKVQSIPSFLCIDKSPGLSFHYCNGRFIVFAVRCRPITKDCAIWPITGVRAKGKKRFRETDYLNCFAPVVYESFTNHLKMGEN